jgi:glucose-6-phosphate 1-epimerase
MKSELDLSCFERFTIPNRVQFVPGNGDLTKVVVTATVSTAEIYLHGAHLTGFQKNGEPPLLFLSGKSHFTPGKPIRGGVPICFPWFGDRDADVAHGYARITEWEIAKTSATRDGKSVSLHFRLPVLPERIAWENLRAEFIVTVSDQLTMELIAMNDSNVTMEIENCLHTYFHVGDIGAVSLTGLQGAPFLDNAVGGNGARKVENDPTLRITRETNRIYQGTTNAVEIRDEHFQRIIRVAKYNSASTVVWNPWTTQLLADFDPAEHKHMVCVESANVKQDKISLAPGQTTTLKVVLSSRPI